MLDAIVLAKQNAVENIRYKKYYDKPFDILMLTYFENCKLYSRSIKLAHWVQVGP